MSNEERKYPAALFQPDTNTDYVYLNVTRAEAIERFKQNEDWERLYEPAGYVPEPQLVEEDHFILWRNPGEDMAQRAEKAGMPSFVVDLLRGS